MEIALVLGPPLAGAVLLALFGERRWAPEINAFMSFATLAAAGLLTARVIADGPREQVKADPQVKEIYLGA